MVYYYIQKQFNNRLIGSKVDYLVTVIIHVMLLSKYSYSFIGYWHGHLQILKAQA